MVNPHFSPAFVARASRRQGGSNDSRARRASASPARGNGASASACRGLWAQPRLSDAAWPVEYSGALATGSQAAKPEVAYSSGSMTTRCASTRAGSRIGTVGRSRRRSPGRLHRVSSPAARGKGGVDPRRNRPQPRPVRLGKPGAGHAPPASPHFSPAFVARASRRRDGSNDSRARRGPAAAARGEGVPASACRGFGAQPHPGNAAGPVRDGLSPEEVMRGLRPTAAGPRGGGSRRGHRQRSLPPPAHAFRRYNCTCRALASGVHPPPPAGAQSVGATNTGACARGGAPRRPAGMR